jgi:hypothetical protein
MMNSSTPASTTVTYQGFAAAVVASAPNPAKQPNGTTLDALDGRLQAAPHQLNGRLWWARTVDFPNRDYGYIDESSLAVTEAYAYVSGTPMTGTHPSPCPTPAAANSTSSSTGPTQTLQKA